jgi:hypothetical protein
MPVTTDSTSRTLLEAHSGLPGHTGHVGEQGSRRHQHQQSTDDAGFL